MLRAREGLRLRDPATMWGWEQLYFNVKDGFLGALPAPVSLRGPRPRCRAAPAARCAWGGRLPPLRALAPPCRTARPPPPPLAEAIVRGHKSGLLTVPDYNNLTQCEALDDIKLNLVRGRGVPPRPSVRALAAPKVAAGGKVRTRATTAAAAAARRLPRRLGRQRSPAADPHLRAHATSARPPASPRPPRTTAPTSPTRRPRCSRPPSWTAAPASSSTTGTRCGARRTRSWPASWTFAPTAT